MRKNAHLLSGIRQLEAHQPTTEEYIRQEYLCADGKAQIDVRIYDGLEWFDPLSMGRQRELNGDIYAFIDGKLYTIPTHYPIRICFRGPLPDPATQAEIRSILQEHYLFALRDKRLDLRINRLKSIVLGAIGMTLLMLYFALELSDLQPLFMEFLSIAGSFAIWEAVDFWLLERRSLDLEYLFAGQAALSEITFSEL